MGTQVFTVDETTKLPPDGVMAALKTAITGGSVDGAVLQSGSLDITTIKSDTDTRPGVWEYVHNSSSGYIFHLRTGMGAQPASALLGLGIGVFLNTEKTGVGINIQQNDSIASPTAYGVYGHQLSKTAPLIHIDHDAGRSKLSTLSRRRRRRLRTSWSRSSRPATALAVATSPRRTVRSGGAQTSSRPGVLDSGPPHRSRRTVIPPRWSPPVCACRLGTVRSAATGRSGSRKKASP
jgi:hypothetical protein